MRRSQDITDAWVIAATHALWASVCGLCSWHLLHLHNRVCSRLQIMLLVSDEGCHGNVIWKQNQLREATLELKKNKSVVIRHQAHATKQCREANQTIGSCLALPHRKHKPSHRGGLRGFSRKCLFVQYCYFSHTPNSPVVQPHADFTGERTSASLPGVIEYPKLPRDTAPSRFYWGAHFSQLAWGYRLVVDI